MMFSIVQNTLSPSISDVISVNGVPFDLTNSSLKFQMRPVGSATLVVNASGTIVTPTAGTVRYDWSAPDVATAGDYVAWWHVTLNNGKVQDSPEFAVLIIPHGERNVFDLCTLTDVRKALEVPDASTVLDDTIRAYISIASKAIMDEYQREFAPVTTAATRRFKVLDNNRVDFSPYDLSSATNMVLYPDLTGGPTLLETTDFQLQPIPNPEGVYTSASISLYRIIIDQTQLKYGNSLVDVTGNWGFPSVPLPVQQACVVTVKAWLRRDASAYANRGGYDTPTELQPDLQATYALPPAARRLLAPYRRNIGAI